MSSEDEAASAARREAGGSGAALVSRSVAVIGAGAAGLVAARSLRDEGHRVTVFEQARDVGGVWVYDAAVEEDVLGGAPSQVHSSMYESLRTNLPREVMGYSDFFFTPHQTYADPRRFCGHREVRAYLSAFAEEFELRSLIRFERRVETAKWIPAAQAAEAPAAAAPGGSAPLAGDPPGAWEVVTAASSGGGEQAAEQEVARFDALMVCNGHYSQPRVPHLPGEESFPGRIMHSHSYRSAEGFAGQRVLVLGASASGEDIARDISAVAAEVYLCARTWQNPEWAHAREAVGQHGNIWRRPSLAELMPDGRVRFEGAAEPAAGAIDAVVYCTGYQYTFPFLDLGPEGVVQVQDNWVRPLHEHLWPPALAPWLSFIGLPWKIVPFPLFELQSLLVARTLSGRAALPPREELERGARAAEERVEPRGPLPRRHAHMLGDDQFAYNDRLADACGVPRLPAWRQKLYKYTGNNKRSRPEAYRDEWEEGAPIIAEAEAQSGVDGQLSPQSAESADIASRL